MERAFCVEVAAARSLLASPCPAVDGTFITRQVLHILQRAAGPLFFRAGLWKTTSAEVMALYDNMG